MTAPARTLGVHEPAVPLTWRQTAGAYFALTKPRIIELLLVTTFPAMVVAADGIPNLWLALATLLGGSLAAGGANTINCYIDRDIDAIMRRTHGRPIPAGLIKPDERPGLRHRPQRHGLRLPDADGQPADGLPRASARSCSTSSSTRCGSSARPWRTSSSAALPAPSRRCAVGPP